MQSHSRRRVLQGIGTGSTLALAGCLANAPSATQPTDEPSNTDTIDQPREIDVSRIAADPTDIPSPVDWDEPREHEITLRTEELVAEVEDGVTFSFMTYNGQIPGPMIRVRRGDTVTLTFEVPDDLNATVHNVDFHAVYGPGGGADATTVTPGGTAEIRFRAEFPGAFIYHCAVPNMDHHISAGMFGTILVEPEDGLPPVDREFYLGQHELYTNHAAGTTGHHKMDFERMNAEDPTYVLLNGAAYGLTEDRHGAIEAKVGETARIYYVNGGPNRISSWHPIGNVWSTVYPDGSVLSDPHTFVETTTVGPGTTTITELEFPVPGPVKLVDHALTRVIRKGMLAVINVEGEENEDIYSENP